MTYFALTLFNILLLIFYHQITSYNIASLIKWNRIIAIIYGLALIILAIVAIVLEDRDKDEIGDRVWAALSTNQKDYFDNDVDKLKDERATNNLFVGIFAIVIGICFMIIGALMFKLHALEAPEIVKQVTARIPTMTHH